MNNKKMRHDHRMMLEKPPRAYSPLTYSTLFISTFLFFFIIFTCITTPFFCWC